MKIVSFKTDDDMNILLSYYKALVAVVRDFPCTEYLVPLHELIDIRIRKSL